MKEGRNERDCDTVRVSCKCGVTYALFVKPNTKRARLRVYYALCPACGFNYNKFAFRKEDRCTSCNIPQRCFKSQNFFKRGICRNCAQDARGKKPICQIVDCD